ncbi:hypothetical protein N7481_003189 [Penicillium waksmanii]|uniref:uncharacterized protein n=1 Tax=Penicillium waksmanii TaxID=69791 RepID=UPI002549BB79|nr:uncharacterized protein N7481_003189 [Penicillium waksmanii]KAJ5987979.1 hypothetical protein N7481_003189 [Penicillium waksmanii]
MNEESAEASLMAYKDKRLRLLYEPLGLLHALGEVRGDRIKTSDLNDEGRGLSGPRCHRNLVDAISYICAYRKEPGYVTAAAIEEAPDAIVVLLAANGGIDVKVVTFLETVLKILSWVIKNPSGVRLTKTEGRKIMKILAEHVLAFNAPKIFQYYLQVSKMVPSLLMRLSTEPALKDDVSMIKLRSWFTANLSKDGLPLQERDMPILAFSSYDNRKIFEALHNHTGNLEQTRGIERLFKLLYKLGKHVAQCKRLLEATIALHSELARGFRIETISGSPEKRTPLLPRTCKIKDISNRMFSESDKRDAFLRQLQQIYPGTELDRVLSKDVSKGKTRVHAELLVLDHFEKTGGRFIFEQDRNQDDILSRMTDTVRMDLKNDIAAKVGRRVSYADSTAGGISTIIDMESDLIPFADDLSLPELLRAFELPNQNHYSPKIPPMGSVIYTESLLSNPRGDSLDGKSDDDSDAGGVKV